MSGDVLRLKAAKHYGENGKDWMELKAHAGTVMVAIILGSEELKDPKGDFDCAAALARLGYQPMADNPELIRLRAIEAAARRYVVSVSGGPEDDIWDTEDGMEADFAWKAYDDEKQNAFDALRSVLGSEVVPVE
jgi:hypothetical protein